MFAPSGTSFEFGFSPFSHPRARCFIQSTFVNTCFEHISTIFGQVANTVVGYKRRLLLLLSLIYRQTNEKANKQTSKQIHSALSTDSMAIRSIMFGESQEKRTMHTRLRCVLWWMFVWNQTNTFWNWNIAKVVVINRTHYSNERTPCGANRA